MKNRLSSFVSLKMLYRRYIWLFATLLLLKNAAYGLMEGEFVIS